MKQFLLLCAMLALFLLGLARAAEASEPPAVCAACKKLESARQALKPAGTRDFQIKILRGIESLHDGLKEWESVKTDPVKKSDFIRQYVLLSHRLMEVSREPDPVECLFTLRQKDEAAVRGEIAALPIEIRQPLNARMNRFLR